MKKQVNITKNISEKADQNLVQLQLVMDICLTISYT